MVCKRFSLSKHTQNLYGSHTDAVRKTDEGRTENRTKVVRNVHERLHENSTKTTRSAARKLHGQASMMAKKRVLADVTVSVAELLAENTTARTSGRGRRSQLYLWLRAHHDQLLDGFRGTGPSWSQIATHLGDNGVVDGAGKAPAPETVRATWYRVRGDVAAARATHAESAASDPTRAVVFTPSRPAPPAFPVSDSPTPNADFEEEELPLEPEFKFAAIPSWSAPERSDAPRTPAVSLRQDPDEVVARLLARPKRGIIPMPDIPEPEDE
jgi:hypothetical protein